MFRYSWDAKASVWACEPVSCWAWECLALFCWLVLMKLGKKGELLVVVPPGKAGFGKACWGSDRGSGDELPWANVGGGVYFWTVLPGAGRKQTPPPDPFLYRVPNRGRERRIPFPCSCLC